ncbi:chaplin [Streptomyces sp. J2-1]|uniref:chaplin n=1 Tax=Streptomyces corallincola TaxID=2851888 RepID=UPI001C393477|nr:chaplin [Streptomyces corallincola]MBV2352986.1 chaplin [Streptomyces corallincola]
MKRTTRNGLIAAVAASGAMAVAMPVSAAFAADGASADGAAVGSPGVVSGNTVQVPIDVPVNVCGNTVDGVGLLNPASGNACASIGGAATSGKASSGRSVPAGGSSASRAVGGSSSTGGAPALGDSVGSPGLLSGNGIKIPVEVPVNLVGNSVNVVGIGNPATGNQGGRTPGKPAQPTPAPKPPAPVKSPPGTRGLEPAPVASGTSLAHTGTDLTTPLAAGSAALLLTGTVLYRRARSVRPY